MPFNVITMREEPCCKDATCLNERGVQDCENCGASCKGCRWTACQEYERTHG